MIAINGFVVALGIIIYGITLTDHTTADSILYCKPNPEVAPTTPGNGLEIMKRREVKRMPNILKLHVIIILQKNFPVVRTLNHFQVPGYIKDEL